MSLISWEIRLVRLELVEIGIRKFDSTLSLAHNLQNFLLFYVTPIICNVFQDSILKVIPG